MLWSPVGQMGHPGAPGAWLSLEGLASLGGKGKVPGRWKQEQSLKVRDRGPRATEKLKALAWGVEVGAGVREER